MIQSYYDGVVLFDTSAVIALHDPEEPRHQDVLTFFSSTKGLVWAALDLTSHECFTTVRYTRGYQPALEHYSFLRECNITLIRFQPIDEVTALDVLRRYQDHEISFHDALCFAAMKRLGIYRVVSIDSDFRLFGVEVLPHPLARPP